MIFFLNFKAILLIDIYPRRLYLADNISREIKSSLFIDYFGIDEVVGKQNFLELYNAIHDTHYTLENCELKLRLIDDTVYKTYKNDLGMEIDGHLVVLMEHQSTINNNMPLRFLEYITRIYSSIVPGRARYLTGTYPVPTPEFFVFYNGKSDLPAVSELKLSDAFMESTSDPALELKVKIYNIGNTDLPFVNKCDKIKQYSNFINYVYEHADMQDPNSCKEVIRQARKEGFLPNYLERKMTEVENMLCAKYDYDLDIQVKQEEAFANGMKQGISQGLNQERIETAKRMLEKQIDEKIISIATKLSSEQIQQIKKRS